MFVCKILIHFLKFLIGFKRFESKHLAIFFVALSYYSQANPTQHQFVLVFPWHSPLGKPPFDLSFVLTVLLDLLLLRVLRLSSACCTIQFCRSTLNLSIIIVISRHDRFTLFNLSCLTRFSRPHLRLLDQAFVSALMISSRGINRQLMHILSLAGLISVKSIVTFVFTASVTVEMPLLARFTACRIDKRPLTFGFFGL